LYSIQETDTTVEPDAKDRSGPKSFLRQLQAIKESVRIEVVAADYGEPRLVGGGRLVMRCISPSHEDKHPSLTLYPEEQRFKCFGCGEYGDVLDLVQLAEDGELWEAMIGLSVRYGIELPGRPESWFRRQRRQAEVRDAYEAAWVGHYQRRIFRTFLHAIERIEDTDQRREEIELLWDIAGEIGLIWRAAILAERSTA
jgi:DNA primase